MNRTIRNFRCTNMVLFSCTIVCLICYDIFGGLWLKGFTSSWFVALGMSNLLFARRCGFADMGILRWILAGLIFGMLADIFLGIAFVLGVVAFALGHGCYLIAFFKVDGPCRQDLFFILPAAVLSSLLCFCTPFIRVEDPVMRNFLAAYCMILGAMLGKAVSNYLKEKSKFRLFLLLGALLFWFSDLILGIDMFGRSSRLTWVLCSYNYWPAQAITAHSLYYLVLEKIDPNR